MFCEPLLLLIPQNDFSRNFGTIGANTKLFNHLTLRQGMTATQPTPASFSIYNASAGSGKTYTLVKEYLKIILTANKPDAYRNILAITFTNKAVHEMKSRVIKNLTEFAKLLADQDPNSVELMQRIAQETNLSLPKMHEKANQIIKHLIHNYAAFDISTIDKFTHKVIRAFAHDLDLPVSFEVSLDTENLVMEAVDALIAQAGDDPALTKLLIDFTMEKTDDDKSWDISREILETGKLLVNENNREEIALLKDYSIDQFAELKRQLNEHCVTIEFENQELAKQLLQSITNMGIQLSSFSAGHFPKHLQGIAAGNYNPKNKQYHEESDIKILKAAPDAALILQAIPTILDALGIIYTQFERRDFYKAFLKNCTPLSLVNKVSQELQALQTEQHILSISEFNALIYREIQNQPAPFIYERLGERYRHFFIDEFQDTSEMQWQNLVPLIDNALCSEDLNGTRGSLLLVGDPKQSIYRWRGGKAEQFIALSKKQSPFNAQASVFSLDTNYRSYSQIIEFNNELFAFLSAEFAHPDYKELYEKWSRQLTNAKKGGYVSIHFLPEPEQAAPESTEDTPDKTKQQVVATYDTIQRVLAQGFAYQDIAILTRKRDQGVAVASYLTEMQLPLLSSETLLLDNAPQVQCLLTSLRYLNNPNNKEAKALFLLYLAQNLPQPQAIHDFIAAGMSCNTEIEFEAWLCQHNLHLSFASLRKKSLYEAVELLVAQVLQQERSNAYVQYFLDIVLERDLRNQAGIVEFLSFWDKNASKLSIPSPEGTNAIRILTIHKAKGLEFPVVIMPFADEDYARKPKDKLWLDADQAIFGIPKILVDNNAAVANFGPEAKAVYEQKKEEELLDNINVLYVALTRAEEQLHIISQQVKPKADGTFPNTMSAFFAKYLAHLGLYKEDTAFYDWGSTQKLSQPSKSKTVPIAVVPVAQAIDSVKIKIAQREALMWNSPQQEAIAYGNVIHEIAANIFIQDDLPQALQNALDSGIIAAQQLNAVTESLSQLVCHPDLAEVFAAGNKVWNEQAILQPQAAVVKPDRIVQLPSGEVILLDYKTGIPKPQHQQQLADYQQVLAAMGFVVAKKLIVYLGETPKVIHL
jgi:ATP-dependent exoDNAse (exonuclease V) beta subunit